MTTTIPHFKMCANVAYKLFKSADLTNAFLLGEWVDLIEDNMKKRLSRVAHKTSSLVAAIAIGPHPNGYIWSAEVPC